MPGSLYPFSPSQESEADFLSSARPRVHFDGSSPFNPVDLTDDDEGCQPGPSRSRKAATTMTPQKVQPSSLIPNRPPSSVKAAVARFKDDRADPSILLPNKTTSPTQMSSRSQGPLSTPSPLQRESSTNSRTKGKAPMRSTLSPFDFGPSEHEESFTSRQIREQISETTAAIQNHEGSSEEDKRRIRALEEEVRRLKEEVCNPLTFEERPEKLIFTSSLLAGRLLHFPVALSHRHLHRLPRLHLARLSV